MKAPREEEVQLLLILNLGTRWGWLVSVTPRPRFTPGEKTPSTHWAGGWVAPRAGLDAGARRKILCLCRGSPGSALLPAAGWYTVTAWMHLYCFTQVKTELPPRDGIGASSPE
jgi:hypothetical protein